MEATLAMKVEELRDANEKVEDLQNSLETLQHLGKCGVRRATFMF